MTQAFKYLLLQLFCVSDSKDDADAASVEADRRRHAIDDLDQRPAWDRDGYPDEDTARITVERVNELLRSVGPERRAPIRRRLSTHGYPPAIFVAEIGGINRFQSPRKLSSWAGLTPTHRESDEKIKRGHITKQGLTLVRWAAIEAVTKRRGGDKLRADYHRIAQSAGKFKARVAVARKLLTLVYYGLRDGEIRCLEAPPSRVSGSTYQRELRVSSWSPSQGGAAGNLIEPAGTWPNLIMHGDRRMNGWLLTGTRVNPSST
jgi:hypothetical protein